VRASAYIALTAVAVTVVGTARAADSQIDRGKYLVTFGLCNDCHTPGYFFGKPDMAQFLGGSDVAFEIPGLGAFPGRNITPDKETGIGNWTSEQIVTALQTESGRMAASLRRLCLGTLLRTSRTRTRWQSPHFSRAYRRSSMKSPAPSTRVTR